MIPILLSRQQHSPQLVGLNVKHVHQPIPAFANRATFLIQGFCRILSLEDLTQRHQMVFVSMLVHRDFITTVAYASFVKYPVTLAVVPLLV